MDSIQLGLDLATSLSVGVAAITFIFQQRRNRHLSQQQYAVDNLKSFLDFLKGRGQDWDDLGNMLRRTAASRAKEIDATPELANTLLDEHFLEVILFVEGVQRELQSQIRTYFPVFFSNSLPPRIRQFDDELTDVLELLRNPSRKERAPALERVEPILFGLTDAFAKELRKILRA